MARAGMVYLVGAGPGDPGLITWRGLEILRSADVVIYDRLVSLELLLEARPNARQHYAGKAAADHSLGQSEINQLLVAEAKAGRSVCRLKGGDPFLFGRGGEEADYLLAHGVEFEVVPGVTSATAVPAYAGIPVTDRRAASTLAIATGHEDADKNASQVDWAGLARSCDTLVVLMGMKNLHEITQEMLQAGRDGATPAAVIQWGTTGMQQTIFSNLARISDEVERRGFAAPAIFVLGEVVAMGQRLDWFEKRPLRGLRILVTRPRHQASVLARLLRESGAEPLICSLTRVEPIGVDAGQLRSLLRRRWDWVLFTSANGVSCFGSLLLQAGLDWRSLAGARLGVMGPGTGAELEKCQLRVDCAPSRAVAESLAAELPDVSPGTQILLPRAEEARDALPRLLEERGASVEVLVVYRSVQDADGSALALSALEKGEVDIITFTSSSGAQNLLNLAGPELLNRRVIASIGPITSQTLRASGLNVAVEAQEHTIPGLVKALQAYITTRRGRTKGD